eukprot:238525_1
MAEQEQYAFEVSGPTLISSNVGQQEIKKGTMYMVTVGAHFRFPIHPVPNADHKIAKLVRQHEVIVTSDETDDSGLYIKTVLPVSGWIRKSCIDDGTLIKVTKDTYDDLIDKTQPTRIPNCCVNCIRSCGCFSNIATSIRKHPVYVMAGILILHFLAELVIFADLLTDVAVAITLSYAEENWLFMLTCVFILAPYYIAWAAAFGYLQKRAMESTANKEFANDGKGDKEVNATDASDMADVKIKDLDDEEQEIDDKKDSKYKEKVLKPKNDCNTLVISLEASSPYGWAKYSHKQLGIPEFGKSAPLAKIR